MPRPDQVTTAAEFLAAMRALRGSVGLTYRQLEERALARGENLTRGMIPNAMARGRVPQARTVASFVRACGGDRRTVEAWLAVRKRITATDRAVTDLAHEVEVWLNGRWRSRSGENRAPHRTVTHLTPELSMIGLDGDMESTGQFTSRRLAEAVQNAEGDLWIGVHRRATKERPPGLARFARRLVSRSA